MRRFSRFFAALVFIANVTASAPCRAEGGALPHPQTVGPESPDGGIMLADILVARPIGLAACLVGLFGTVLAAPFAAVAGNMDEVTQRLVGDPFAFTFERPVGHFPGELHAR